MLSWLFGTTRERSGGEAHNMLPSGRAVELELYKFDSCPFCKRVFRVLDTLDVTVAYHDTRQDPAARQRLMALTGRTQVPCLVIDGKPMLESATIVAWLRENAAVRG